MSDIVAFLRARLDEDEAIALAAPPPVWEDTGLILAGVVASQGQPPMTGVTIAECNRSTFEGGEYSYPAEPEEAARAAHIARHDPARVLLEVEAKRQIVDWCTGGKAVDGGYWMFPPLEMLAAVYADHPDYDPEWRLQAASTS